jgi:hypothetical protein
VPIAAPPDLSPGPLADALEQWERGAFDACLELLDGHRRSTGVLTREATMLRARALMRLQRPAEALLLLRQTTPASEAGDEAVTARMLTAAALARCETLEGGLEGLLNVHAAATGFVADALLAEIEYEIALVSWTLRNDDHANAWALGSAERKADLVSVRATALRAWILLGGERPGEALGLFERALDDYDRCTTHDEPFRWNLVHAIAMLQANLAPAPLSNPLQRARAARQARVKDTLRPSAPVLAVKTAIEDAWAFAAIDGDATNALRAARRAHDIQPAACWGAWTLALRAAITRGFDESSAARDYAESALAIALETDWERTADEERLGLLAAAEQVRHFDPPAALELLARFDGIRTGMRPRYANDARLRVYYDLVRGSVHASAGEPDRAYRHLADSYAALTRAGYLSRAVEALIELDAIPVTAAHPLVQDGARTHLEAARELIQRHFPNSFLRNRLQPRSRHKGDRTIALQRAN